MFDRLSPDIQSLILTLPAILPAIVLHECAHGWVSYKLGDPTAHDAGRLTLNPIKHLDPIGALCMLFIHFGWAKPVPVNSTYYKHRRKGIILVSLAGPATNFILAFISLFAAGLTARFGSSSSELCYVIYEIFVTSAVININLAFFNLVPVPPLDGSNVLAMVFTKVSDFYQKYHNVWRIILLILLSTGALSKPLGFLNTHVLSGMWKIVSAVMRF